MNFLFTHVLILALIGGGQCLQCKKCGEASFGGSSGDSQVALNFNRVCDADESNNLETCGGSEDICVTYTYSYTELSQEITGTDNRCAESARLEDTQSPFCQQVKERLDTVNFLAPIDDFVCDMTSCTPDEKCKKDEEVEPDCEKEFCSGSTATQQKLFLAVVTIVFYRLF